MATKVFIFFSVLSLHYYFSIAQSKTNEPGAAIFTDKCAKCHGHDGTKGRWGAKNLQKSILTEEELTKIISEGKNFMPSWKKRLSGDELRQVIAYVKTLRK